MKKQIAQLWRDIWRAGHDRDDAIAAVAHTLMQRADLGPLQRPPFRLMADVPEAIAEAVNAGVDAGNPRQAAEFLRLFIEAELTGKGETGQFASTLALREILATLADIGPSHSLIDPACGTGQLLACRPDSRGKTAGIEYSHLWAYVAVATCRLNGIGRPEIIIGDAFSSLLGQLFDRGICNPPFGWETPPPDWRWRAGGDTIRRESPFIQFMREHLRPNGESCAAMLVSDEFLSGGDSGSTLYRRELIESGSVRACITLPAAVISARNTVPGSALLLGRPFDGMVWLADASYCPPADIPKRITRWRKAVHGDKGGIHRCPADRRIIRVFRLDGKTTILFEERDSVGNIQLHRLARNGRAVPEHRQDEIAEDMTLLLDLADQGAGARAIHATPSFIGLGFHHRDLISGDCRLALRADQVSARRRHTPTKRDPDSVLKALLDECRTFTRDLESLAERLEARPMVSQSATILPDLDAGDALSAMQRQIWDHVLSLGSRGSRAHPFTVQDLRLSFQGADDTPNLIQLRQTLAVLECMGLLVRVEGTDQQTRYRLPTIQDQRGGK